MSLVDLSGGMVLRIRTRWFLMMCVLPLLLTACSDTTTDPVEALVAGDIINFDLSLSVQIEEATKGALDVVPVQVQIEARIIEVTNDFLDIELLPMTLSNFQFAGSTGTIVINPEPEYKSWCCLYRRDAQGVPSSRAYGEIYLSLQIGDGPTVMLGGSTSIALTDELTNRNHLIPSLATLPVVGMLFNGSHHDVHTSELVIVMTPRIIEDLE